MKQDDAPTLADLAATPAEIELDPIPERLGEIERLLGRAVGGLTMRINRAALRPLSDR